MPNFVDPIRIGKAEEIHYAIKNVKLAVTGSDGVRRVSESLEYPAPLESPLQLVEDDNLKIILTIRDLKNEKVFHQPHQAFLTLTNEKTNAQAVLILQVRDNGKARLELDMKSAPRELIMASADYTLDLIIGTFSSNHPIKYTIGTAHIKVLKKPSLPPPIKYGPLPEIHHIFKESERLAPIWLTYSFVIIVLTPWIFLIGT
ncbi:hypothetical protein G9A89_009071, partial [Geosiphon pyriformis]